jgi:hypothetical protein
LDEIETISMYTMDAEGELEDEELIVEGILVSATARYSFVF